LLAAGETPRVPCSALVLVDITPRGNEAGRLHIRRFMRSSPDGFGSIEDAADAVAAFLPDRPRPSDPSGLKKNLRLRADGRYYWHWDPALMSDERLENTAARSTPERLEAAARAVSAPVLLVRGARSGVVTDDDVVTFRKLMPQAEYASVAGASHMVAGDRNDRFNHATLDFLRRHLDLPGPSSVQRDVKSASHISR
jgi:pimeloyl-ACP methyl ester carboxylesterase